MESCIGSDFFSNLTNFRRQRVDIAAFRDGVPAIIISSKWGVRHDRLRDPQEEADTYKKEIPGLKFFVVTNEFDDARLQQLLRYPTIDGVFHTRRALVLQLYGSTVSSGLANLKDLTDLFTL
ncbi:MAG: hypothetical protein ACYDBJ_02545 [Aggregatilineales bacterium]